MPTCACARGAAVRLLHLRPWWYSSLAARPLAAPLAGPPPPITGYLRARVFACLLPQDTWYPAEDRHGNLYSGFDDGKVQNTSVGSACTRPAPKYVKALGLAGLAAR